MSTVRDLIKDAMTTVGILAAGEAPPASEQSDGLKTLNRMLNSWSLESLMIPGKVREDFVLIPNQQAFTMGPTGDFDTIRPVRIEKALIKDIGGAEIPIALINLDMWASISVKETESSLPTKLYIAGTSPLETLNLWPIPNIANTLILYSWKALSHFASANVDVELPAGYEDAIVYNLGVRLAAQYGKPIDAVTMQIAIDAKASIKRINSKVLLMGVDAALMNRGRGFNILTGE